MNRENRYGFIAAELPTSEIKVEAKSYISDRSLLEELEKLLDITDFVKFAKYIPLEHEMLTFLDTAEKFGRSTSRETEEKI